LLKIVTFNIRYDEPKDGIYAWPLRRQRAINYLLSGNFDIICLQETTPGQRLQIDQALSHKYEGFGRGRNADGQGEQCPIYWKRDRFKCLASQVWWLSSHPDEPGSRTWTGYNDTQDGAPWLPRIATEISLRDGLREFQVINTHFDHQLPHIRTLSANLVRQRYQNTGPCIVTGDFNAEHGEGCVEIFEEWTQNANRLQAGSRPITWHEFKGSKWPQGQHIDFIFATKHWTVEGYHVENGSDNPPTNPYLSDHFPVEAQVRFV
jgi:endonuclease/exonuclease/phosphatase family metal-dependent hydrolase